MTYKQIVARGGAGLLHYYRQSLTRALSAIYPQHTWTLWRFSNRSPDGSSKKHRISKMQVALHTCVQKMFPDETVHSNYKFQKGIEFDVSDQ